MAGSDGLPGEVREFLQQEIASYEDLEVLLLLRRRSDQTWSAEAVGVELRVPVIAAAEALDHLCARKILELQAGASTRAFRYAPVDPSLAATIDQLAHAYDVDLLRVINLMNENAIHRVKTQALHSFADAFVLGRKKNTDG